VTYKAGFVFYDQIYCTFLQLVTTFHKSLSSTGHSRLLTTRPLLLETTDGQSASLSWNKAPICGLWPDFYYCQTVAGLLMWGALSDERTGLSFTIAAGLASAVILGSESRGSRDHILVYKFRNFTFRPLLRLAGLRWRYATPPPQGGLGFWLHNLGSHHSTENTLIA
jgi:hypothetical protein